MGEAMGKGGYNECMGDAMEADEKFQAEFKTGMHRCLLEPDKQSAQQKSRFYTTSNGPMEPHMEDWMTPHVVGKRGFASVENMKSWYRQRNKQRGGGSISPSGPSMLDNDIERIKAENAGTPLSIRIRTKDGVWNITVDETQPVQESLCHALGLSPSFGVSVSLGGTAIYEGTFTENGVFEDAVVDISQMRSTFDVVVDDLLDLHAGSETITRESVTELAEFDESAELQSWVLSGLGLTRLPKSFGDLSVAQDIWLTDNAISALPASFKNVTVGGKVWLMRNPDAMLRSICGAMTLGGKVVTRDPPKSESCY